MQVRDDAVIKKQPVCGRCFGNQTTYIVEFCSAAMAVRVLSALVVVELVPEHCGTLCVHHIGHQILNLVLVLVHIAAAYEAHTLLYYERRMHRTAQNCMAVYSH